MQQSVLINMIAILTTSVQKQFLFINQIARNAFHGFPQSSFKESRLPQMLTLLQSQHGKATWKAMKTFLGNSCYLVNKQKLLFMVPVHQLAYPMLVCKIYYQAYHPVAATLTVTSTDVTVVQVTTAQSSSSHNCSERRLSMIIREVQAAVMPIFIDFHQGPPRTIWQGPRSSATAQVVTP